jgi:UDP:flavonoid glycosyltransferase YjiC (YdhE family)
MKKVLILATGGAGGDLQPLIAATRGLHQRGHEITLFGDSSAANSVRDLGIKSIVSPPENDLGPYVVTMLHRSLNMDPSKQGQMVLDLLVDWADKYTPLVEKVVRENKFDLLVTSTFGADVAYRVTRERDLPWSAINSTFYFGPESPRDASIEFGIRSVECFRDYLNSFLQKCPLVLHSTDAQFDYNLTNLPANNFYVGPLIWEAPSENIEYLEEPGKPWVLVTLSSQEQDDIPLADETLRVLSQQEVRVALTIGRGHQSTELKAVPANVRIGQYIPHSRVLERSILMVSHAGHGSVMKALWYGVPMVLVPWGRDQPGVAARTEHLGVAKVVARNQLADGSLANAIKLVLNDKSYKERAYQYSLRLKQQDSVGMACDLLGQL